jgi:hypothetical protein
MKYILEVFYSMINCPLQPSLSPMRGSLVLNTPRVPLCFIMLEIQIPCICSVTGNPTQADHSSSLTTQVQHAIMWIIWIQKLQQVQQYYRLQSLRCIQLKRWRQTSLPNVQLHFVLPCIRSCFTHHISKPWDTFVRPFCKFTDDSFRTRAHLYSSAVERSQTCIR